MMIVMKAGATEAEIQSVIDRIESVGARAHPSRGEDIGSESARTTDDAARAAPTTVSRRTSAPRRSRDCRWSAWRGPIR